jgi:flagella basal body P-ring formation protein FlgA
LRALAGALPLAAALATPSAAAIAAERQSVAEIRKAVQEHLRRQSAGLPGEVSFTIGSIDPRLSLAACPSLETFPAPSAAPWGNSTVGVRCRAGEAWTVYVPVTIHVVAEYAVTARPIAQGQTLSAPDISMQRGDLAQLPAGIVTDPQQAIGRKLAVGIVAGQPLRQDMLRAPLIIQQGQAVKIVSRGRGFQVSAEGRAITSAQEGQVVQVRTPAGPVVSGTARPGPVVEIPSGG